MLRSLRPSLARLSLTLLLGMLGEGVGIGEPALASTSSAASRAQADRALNALRSSSGVGAGVARIRFVGEEQWGADRVAEMLRDEKEPEARRNLSDALAQLAVKSSEPTLVSLTSDADPTVRMNAAEGLGRIETRRSSALLPLLGDRNAGVRRRAADALGRTQDVKQAHKLIRAAKLEDEPLVRAALLVAVGRLGAKSEAKGLEHFLQSSAESTRYAAARALCLLEAPAGLAIAQRLLRSAGRFDKRQGVLLFEGLPLSLAEPALAPVLAGKDASVAALAARVLYRSGSRKMLEWLVIRSHETRADEKLAYERELETLMVSDEQRAAILRDNGLGR